MSLTEFKLYYNNTRYLNEQNINFLVSLGFTDTEAKKTLLNISLATKSTTYIIIIYY